MKIGRDIEWRHRGMGFADGADVFLDGVKITSPR